MSTLTGRQNLKKIESEEDLWSYFSEHAKPASKKRLGLEAEFLGVHQDTGKALSYSGPKGIESVLLKLAELYKYEPILECGRVIALKRGETVISLEPGGQVELSAAPVWNVFELEKQVLTFAAELRAVAETMPGIAWLSYGIQPFTSIEEVEWVPKRRYQIMADYLGSRGSHSHWMMKLTATNQISYDYVDEEDAMSSLRTVLSVTSIASAMFANSSFSQGKPNGFATQRLHIWNHTVPERAGLLIEFTRPGKTFRDFLNYILDLPLLFLVRGDQWIPASGAVNFRQFIKDGWQGLEATAADFEIHLSTAFPEARLKQYLEVRGMDAQSIDMIPSVAAFWKGILYDRRIRDEALELVSFASESDRMKLHQEVPVKGMNAELAGKKIFFLAQDLVDLACKSLGKQRKPELQDECLFIERIRNRIFLPSRSPGETLLAKWKGDELARDPQKLLEYLSI